MPNNNNIPTFKAFVDGTEDTGVNEIAFVNQPAILVKGVAFASEAPKMRIAAPILIPMNVYRYNEQDGEYNVQFTAQEIEKIVQDFQSKSKTFAFNLEHNTGVKAPAYLLETWLVGEDPKLDRSYTTFGIEGIPSGSWFGVAQVTDETYFNQLVANEQTGFSIEGFLGLSIVQNKQTINNEKMNKQFKLADVATIEGNMLFVDGDIAIGTSVFMILPSTGEKVIPADGDIELADGTTINVCDGVICEISAPGIESSEEGDCGEGMDMGCGPKTKMEAEVEVEMADAAPASGNTATAPATEPAPEPAPAEAPVASISVTPEEVAKMIDDKVSEMVSKIAELQTKIDELSNASKPAEAPVTKMSVETKMNLIEKARKAFNN